MLTKAKAKTSTHLSQLDLLEAALLAAHERDDKAALVSLYHDAGAIKELMGNINAACFYFTQAYVFALETGDPASASLLGKLVQYGRDAFPSN
jgi:hypothetical protein